MSLDDLVKLAPVILSIATGLYFWLNGAPLRRKIKETNDLMISLQDELRTELNRKDLLLQEARKEQDRINERRRLDITVLRTAFDIETGRASESSKNLQKIYDAAQQNMKDLEKEVGILKATIVLADQDRASLQKRIDELTLSLMALQASYDLLKSEYDRMDNSYTLVSKSRDDVEKKADECERTVMRVKRFLRHLNMPGYLIDLCLSEQTTYEDVSGLIISYVKAIEDGKTEGTTSIKALFGPTEVSKIPDSDIKSGGDLPISDSSRTGSLPGTD
jgi:chromosome segregation ATPase